MITKLQKKNWLKALNSEKYKQTVGYLKDDVGYCCLGVLCDLDDKKESKTKWKKQFGNWFKYNKAASYLPNSIKLPRGQQKTLAEMNDQGLSFKEIANYIKENVKTCD